MSTVVLYGATGITGTLTARRLASKNFPFAIAGRSEEKLARLRDQLAAGGVRPEVRVADMTDRQALERAFAGSRVVVSAAGPFIHSGEHVLGAAIDAGAHYLDTSGEQAFMRLAYGKYDERARSRGVCAVPGYAFEIALGDLAAEEAAVRLRWGEDAAALLDEVVVAYDVEHFATSQGTRLSALAQLARPGHYWKDGDLVAARPADEQRQFSFPEPFGPRAALSFPSSECLSVPRHVAVRRVQTYLAVSRINAAFIHAGRRLIAPILQSPIQRFAARVSRAGSGPTAANRISNRFCILAEARRDGKSARVSVAGRDIYGLTAAILVDGVEQMLTAGFCRAGTLAPAQAFEARPALERLSREAGLEVR